MECSLADDDVVIEGLSSNGFHGGVRRQLLVVKAGSASTEGYPVAADIDAEFADHAAGA